MKKLDSVLWLVPIVGLIVFWELFARSGFLSPFLLPRFSIVMERIFEDAMSGALFAAMGLTVTRALIGFSIAAVLGVTVGVAMAESRIARWFFEPIVLIGFPTPKIAFLPIFMLWFGLGDASKIALVALTCFFIITLNTYAGASGVERQMIWAARSLGCSRSAVLPSVVLPAATPQILTGLQIALPLGMIITLDTEMIMGGGGIGGQILEASRDADSVGMFAGIVEIAVVGTILIRGLAFLRRKFLHWHNETQLIST